MGPQLSKNEHFGGNEPRLGEEMGILGTKLRRRGCNPPFWGSKEPFQHRGKTPKQRIHGQKGALRALLWCSGAKNGFCGVKGPFFSTKSIIWENKAPTSILKGGIRPPSPTSPILEPQKRRLSGPQGPFWHPLPNSPVLRQKSLIFRGKFPILEPSRSDAPQFIAEIPKFGLRGGILG